MRTRPCPAPDRPQPPLTHAAVPASATDHSVASVTDAIVAHRLQPGARLADIYQVSRTLVRQALNRLSRDRARPRAQAAASAFDPARASAWD